MTITMMKAKSVLVGIKNGMTREDFCEKYQCGSDEFDVRLKQLFGHNKKQLKNYSSQIEANQKKARKDVVEAAANNETAAIAEAAEHAEIDTTPTNVSRSVELERLTKLEEEQSQRAMALESVHKELATRHRELKGSLRRLSENIDKLMAEFQQYHQEFEEILSQNAIVEARMNEVTAEWTAQRTALSDTRDRIKELSVVTLCVYDSGEILPMDGYEVELDDTDWESMRETLLAKDECQELRLKDIATLARLLMIAKHTDCRIEVMCDNAELETTFQNLRG